MPPYTKMEDAEEEFWDPFFTRDQALRTYEFEYDTMYEFEKKTLLLTLAVNPCILMCTLPCLPCQLSNLYDSIHARHIAVNEDGVRYVIEKHPADCRLEICDQGRVSKTVPFDKLTDCDNEEPAGSTIICCCFCVKNVLHRTNIDTANGRELSLVGLKDPEAFKKDVWAMKRGDGLVGVDNSSVPIATVRMGPNNEKSGFFGGKRGTKGGPDPATAELVQLMKKQNALLEETVVQLKTIARK